MVLRQDALQAARISERNKRILESYEEITEGYII